MNFLDQVVMAVEKMGGTAYLVGGSVRDRLLGKEVKDFDVEVHGLPAHTLKTVLTNVTGKPVNEVGASFGVFKVQADGLEFDFSVPRTEKKVGTGHKGFKVTGNPFLGTKEAARRRDFTVNAMMLNLHTETLVDHFGGQADLTDKVLRMVDPETFVEDSLRVLRAVQFAARFGFTVESATVEVCKKMDLSDLPAERLREEVFKWLLKSERPSVGLSALVELGVAKKLFPMVFSLLGCNQREDYHKEKDTLLHTSMVLDVAAKENLPESDKLVLLLAALCHDFGKPLTTKVVNGVVCQHGHEEAGVKPTEDFLDVLQVFTQNGRNLRKEVCLLVRHHLAPNSLYRNVQKGVSQDAAVKRLAATGVNMSLLGLLSKADNLGRHPESLEYGAEAATWFMETTDRLSVSKAAEKALVTGDDLLSLGYKAGPEMGQLLKSLYEKQLDGVFRTKEEGLKLLQ